MSINKAVNDDDDDLARQYGTAGFDATSPLLDYEDFGVDNTRVVEREDPNAIYRTTVTIDPADTHIDGSARSIGLSDSVRVLYGRLLRAISKNRAVLIWCVLATVSSVAQSVCLKRAGDSLKNFPFFLLWTTVVPFVVLFFALYGVMILMGVIKKEERVFPQWKLALIGLLVALNGFLLLFANPHVPGTMQALLGPTVVTIPLAMVFSFFLLKARYNGAQIFAVVVIVLGLFIALMPTIVPKSYPKQLTPAPTPSFFVNDTTPPAPTPAGQGASESVGRLLIWDVIFLTGSVPLVLASVFEERALEKTRVHMMFLLSWLTFWQMISIFVCTPLAWIPGFGPGVSQPSAVVTCRLYCGTVEVCTLPYETTSGTLYYTLDGAPFDESNQLTHCTEQYSNYTKYLTVNEPGGNITWGDRVAYKPKPFFEHQLDGFRCLGGQKVSSCPECECEGYTALMWTILFVFGYCATSLTLLAVVMYGNATFSFIVSTLSLPLSEFAFSFKFIYSDPSDAEHINPYQYGALVVLVCGVILYRVFDSAPKAEDEESGVVSDASKETEFRAAALPGYGLFTQSHLRTISSRQTSSSAMRPYATETSALNRRKKATPNPYTTL